MVNARSGEVAGELADSFWKIFFFVSDVAGGGRRDRPHRRRREIVAMARMENPFRSGQHSPHY